MTATQDECVAQSSRPAWTLSRVIYVTAGVIVAWLALGMYDGFKLSEYILTKDPARFSPLYHAVIAAPFVYVSALALATCFFRPIRNLWQWDKGSTRFSWQSVTKQVLLGLSGGLLVSLLCAAFPTTHRNVQLGGVAEHLSGSNSEYLLVPIFILLVSAIAICTEVFFRGIVMRTLAEYSNLPSSIIASCLLSAYLWSFDTPAATAAILGAVSGILFYKTRFLLSSIVATAVFLTTGPLCSAIFHRLIA
jgi:membrane protease YdiL (CAAX protease family)